MAMRKMGKTQRLNQTNLGNVPSQSGVYELLNQKGDVIYLGKAGAGRLQERLSEHLSQKDIPGAALFRFRTTSSDREAERLEQNYIRRLKPKYNKR